MARPHDLARLFGDTPLDVEQRYLALWRSASPARRLDKVLGMGRAVNALARAEILRRHPDASAREVALRLAARNLDRESMIGAFGWDPAQHGE